MEGTNVARVTQIEKTVQTRLGKVSVSIIGAIIEVPKLHR